jgi:hypothetical protein
MYQAVMAIQIGWAALGIEEERGGRATKSALAGTF